MSNDIERRVVEKTEGGQREGYVPVTPLGPPPQGEPLFAAQKPPPAQAQPQAQTQPQSAPPPSQQQTE